MQTIEKDGLCEIVVWAISEEPTDQRGSLGLGDWSGWGEEICSSGVCGTEFAFLLVLLLFLFFMVRLVWL